ncbi:transmembrane protein fend [Drosophila innubila]|uniref:transmembrane protein fend n=1 Tax=Drosophila innubila TaxID=198719 RepID=UPI00148C56F6|nr:transmembrane protein fend [Drosophila innubila]
MPPQCTLAGPDVLIVRHFYLSPWGIREYNIPYCEYSTINGSNVCVCVCAWASVCVCTCVLSRSLVLVQFSFSVSAAFILDDVGSFRLRPLSLSLSVSLSQSHSLVAVICERPEPTPTPTATPTTLTPTRISRRRRGVGGTATTGTETTTTTTGTTTMFQSFAIFMLLVAVQAQQQYASNADAAAELQATETAATPFGHKQLTRCCQSCYQQFAGDWHYCTDFVDCRKCWQNCQRQWAPFELRVHHAQRQGALVLTDIGWDELIANASRQCLITWEVSGGGLMGNLLTDTARAELSLWPDTVYNIQVTCKHKLTGQMRRSLKLNVDTHQLLSASAMASASASTSKAALPTSRTTTTITNRRTISSFVPVSVPVFMSTTAPSAASTTTKAATTRNAAKEAATTATAATTNKTTVQRVRPTDRVYIISALPTASQLSGVVYPAFGALAFFLALLVMFLFLRPQRKRSADADADTASLLSGRRSSRLSMDNSTLHV